MHKVEIDDETADRIVLCSLKDSIELLEESVIRLQKKKSLKSYEKIDLMECTSDLDALKKTYDYYGGNTSEQ